MREVHTQILFYRLLLMLKPLVIMMFKAKMKTSIDILWLFNDNLAVDVGLSLFTF